MSVEDEWGHKPWNALREYRSQRTMKSLDSTDAAETPTSSDISNNEAQTPPPAPSINPGSMKVGVSSAAARNLYAAYVHANEKGAFGGQSLEHQQLMMCAALEVKQVLGEFDDAMKQVANTQA